MAVIGVDFGSCQSVIATVSKGVITVVRNEISERLTPSLVAFTDKERLIGEAALSQIKSNSRNTCRNFKNLLGRTINDPDLKVEEFCSLCPLVEAVNKTVGYEIMYKGEQKVVSVIAAAAALLTKLRETARTSTGVYPAGVVISCPGWYTDSNRRALLAASEIAGLNCCRVMSEMTATALDYGIYRSRDFSEKDSYRVAFVDIGHSNSAVCIVDFVKGSLKILAEVCYRDLGGRDIDSLIAQHFAKIFFDQYRLDPMKNVKSRLKMEDQASRLKKILSANAEGQFHVEYLVDEYDCTGTLKRQDFEKMCSNNFLIGFQKLMKEAILKSGVSIESIQAVEITGGSCRIPLLQNAVAKFFGKEPSKTLSGDECVARGCALQAAMCCSSYKVREFGLYERANHSIAVGWEGSGFIEEKNTTADSDNNTNVLSNGNTDKKSAIIISSGMFTNACKKLIFERSSSFEVWAYYANPEALLPGTPVDLARCRVILDALPDGSNRTVALTCKIDFHGLFKFEKAKLIETEEFEEIVTEKQPVPSEEVPETDSSASTAENENEEKKAVPEQHFKEVQVRKKSKRTKKTDLKMIVIENPLNLSQKQINDMREIEISMANDDRVHAETKEKMNELEAYIYSSRNNCNGYLKNYMHPDEMTGFIQKLDAAESWLSDNAEEASKSSFVQKLEELHAIGNPAVKRYESHLERNEMINKASQVIRNQKSFIMNHDKRIAHIPLNTRDHILMEVIKLEKWIFEMKNKQESMPLYEDPILKAEQISEKLNELCTMANNAIAQCKPAPAANTPSGAQPEQSEADTATGESNSPNQDSKGGVEYSKNSEDPRTVAQQ